MAISIGCMTCLGSKNSTFYRPSRVPLTASTQRVARPLVCPVQAGLVGYGKKWESLPVNKNGNVIRIKMHVRVGDYVVVIAGSEKGKKGEITKVDTKRGLVWMENVNTKTRYVKPSSEDETGTMSQKESPIHHSNVMHFSKEKNVRSRVGTKVVDGKKIRFLKKTGEELS